MTTSDVLSSKSVSTDPRVRDLYQEWASRVGSQKGQYRLTHAKVGVLFNEIASLNSYVDRLAKGALSTPKPSAAHGTDKRAMIHVPTDGYLLEQLEAALEKINDGYVEQDVALRGALAALLECFNRTHEEVGAASCGGGVLNGESPRAGASAGQPSPSHDHTQKEVHVEVAGDVLTTPLWQFEQRASVILADEQAKASPDNALIGFVCDAVGLARENARQARQPLATKNISKEERADLQRLISRMLPYVQQWQPADAADIDAQTSIVHEAESVLYGLPQPSLTAVAK